MTHYANAIVRTYICVLVPLIELLRANAGLYIDHLCLAQSSGLALNLPCINRAIRGEPCPDDEIAKYHQGRLRRTVPVVAVKAGR